MSSARPQSRNANAEAQKPSGSVETISRSKQSQVVALMALPHAVIGANLTMASELHGFIGRRVKAQAEPCHALCQFNELADAPSAQRRFSSQAYSGYLESFEQIGTRLHKEVAAVAEVAPKALNEANKAMKLAA